MSITNQYESQPWYRNPMVWLVISLPMTAVIAGIITIFIAANTEDGLVVDDYYKKGLEINQVLNHDKKAMELGLRAFLDVNANSGEILVSLSSKKALESPDEITFKLIHRTRSGLDQMTTLIRVGNGDGDGTDYTGYVKPPIIEGRWTTHILSEKTWRLKKDFTTRSADHILLNIEP